MAECRSLRLACLTVVLPPSSSSSPLAPTRSSQSGHALPPPAGILAFSRVSITRDVARVALAML